MLKFTKKEVIYLIIAFIVLSFCFAISTVGTDFYGILSILPLVMVGVGIGCISHETGHKFVAMKYGYQSEFILWPIGLLIAFISSFFGMVLAFPGEARIYADNISDEISGKIAIAGPMTNMALALIFIVIAALVYPLKFHSDIFNLIFFIGAVGFSVNSFLATFNLLPIYSLDGTKVLKWNIGIWIVVFAIALIMMLLSISIGAENMVKLFIGM
ncbi:site-2 protease family protein [Methanobrevibacter sp.]|uniref:site-2 protease family protein n=1 Tax=Methanobrevibacter sp. TaxID=66852 RepID=UPI00388EE2B0